MFREKDLIFASLSSLCGQTMDKFSGIRHGILWLEFQKNY